MYIYIYTYIYLCIHLGGCQNYGPFLGTLNIRCCIIIGNQKGTNFDNRPYIYIYNVIMLGIVQGLNIPFFPTRNQ